ncbi:uncharacterized protein LOC144440573 [Glandiceps talaboti]
MYFFTKVWHIFFPVEVYSRHDSVNSPVRRPAVYGSVTRELFELFENYSTGTGQLVPRDVVKALHEIQLFPSKSQVRVLLDCGRHISDTGRKDSREAITFGEFCILVTELREQQYGLEYNFTRMGCVHGTPVTQQIVRNKSTPRVNGSAKKLSHSSRNTLGSSFEVFLGGACNPTTWRRDIAIPTLKRHGITFYNPQVAEWSQELIEIEEQAKQTAKLLFFVFGEQTRGIASMVEASFLAGANRTIFVVMLGVPQPGSEINEEMVIESEFEDLERGQAFLCDLVERKGLPVFEDIPTALSCAAKVLKEGVKIEDLTPSDGAHPVKHPNGRPGDRLIALKNIFDTYDQEKNGRISVDDVYLAVKSATGRDELTAADFDCIRSKCSCRNDTESIPNVHSLSFEEFCCLVTEYSHGWPSFQRRGCLAYYLATLQTTSRDLCSWLFSNQIKDDIYRESPSMKRDIFLGGSCSTSTWREDIAIPLFRKQGITYYNPRKAQWSIRFIPLEHEAKELCTCLLYVITSTSRGVGSMVEVAHYIGQGRNVVLCIQEVHDSTVVKGEKLTNKAARDYNRGRKYLADVANRNNVPIFEDIKESVECAMNIIQSARSS